MSTRGYKGLTVWNLSIDLVEMIYDFSRNLPESEQHGLVRDLRRSAVAIPTHLAEGHSSGSMALYLRRLREARTAVAGLETHLLIVERLGFVDEDYLGAVQVRVERLGEMIGGLERYLVKHIQTPPAPQQQPQA